MRNRALSLLVPLCLIGCAEVREIPGPAADRPCLSEALRVATATSVSRPPSLVPTAEGFLLGLEVDDAVELVALDAELRPIRTVRRAAGSAGFDLVGDGSAQALLTVDAAGVQQVQLVDALGGDVGPIIRWAPATERVGAAMVDSELRVALSEARASEIALYRITAEGRPVEELRHPAAAPTHVSPGGDVSVARAGSDRLVRFSRGRDGRWSIRDRHVWGHLDSRDPFDVADALRDPVTRAHWFADAWFGHGAHFDFARLSDTADAIEPFGTLDTATAQQALWARSVRGPRFLWVERVARWADGEVIVDGHDLFGTDPRTLEHVLLHECRQGCDVLTAGDAVYDPRRDGLLVGYATAADVRIACVPDAIF